MPVFQKAGRLSGIAVRLLRSSIAACLLVSSLGNSPETTFPRLISS